MAKDLGYAPLPKDVAQRVRTEIGQIKWPLPQSSPAAPAARRVFGFHAEAFLWSFHFALTAA